jgi:nicotinic acid mononucleotide adenylyltransferase
MTRRIAVYGGSFNPFGTHHQDIIRWLIEEAKFTTVLVVPAAAHALKSDLPEFVHRFNMAHLGSVDLNFAMPSLPFGSNVKAIEIEGRMLQRHKPPIYTWDLLNAIKEQYGQTFRKDEEPPQFKFAIGPDVRDEFDKWKGVEDIERDFGFVDVQVFSMRATNLRGMIADGTDLWKRHVPRPVAQYIERNGLYQKRAA